MTETVTNRAFGMNKVNWEEYVSICNVELLRLYLAFMYLAFKLLFFFRDSFWKALFKANVLRAPVCVLFTNSKKPVRRQQVCVTHHTSSLIFRENMGIRFKSSQKTLFFSYDIYRKHDCLFTTLVLLRRRRTAETSSQQHTEKAREINRQCDI